jgi:hypothetical protein
LSTLFSTTKVATNALCAEFKVKSYYNLGFHLDALTSFCFHILRALYDLTAFLLRLLITPFYLLNPFAWLSIPSHMINLTDNFIGLGISMVSIALHPIIFIARTLTSIFRGYEEDTNYDWGKEPEEADLQIAMTLY